MPGKQTATDWPTDRQRFIVARTRLKMQNSMENWQLRYCSMRLTVALRSGGLKESPHRSLHTSYNRHRAREQERARSRERERARRSCISDMELSHCSDRGYYNRGNTVHWTVRSYIHNQARECSYVNISNRRWMFTIIIHSHRHCYHNWTKWKLSLQSQTRKDRF